MAKGKGIGLSVLASIKQEAADKAAGKAAKGDKEHNPAYSADELERLVANTGVIVAKDGTLLLKPANTGARRGRAPRLLIEATPEAVDKLCEGLKMLIADGEAMGEKRASFEKWATEQDAK